MSVRLTRVILAVLAASQPLTALAHHSFAAVFDSAKTIELTGAVTEVQWLNPHVWFFVDVESSDGEIENWGFEMGSPNRLMRSGWSQSSMQPGQVITVSGSLARDGSRKVAVDTVRLATGESLFGAQDSSQ